MSKKKSPKNSWSIDDLLGLVPTDTTDVPTPPDVSTLPPLEGKKRLADYYRSLASLALSKEAQRRARTRAMIILGAQVSTITDPAIRAAIRSHMASTDRPADLAAVAEVVDWMTSPPTPAQTPTPPPTTTPPAVTPPRPVPTPTPAPPVTPKVP